MGEGERWERCACVLHVFSHTRGLRPPLDPREEEVAVSEACLTNELPAKALIFEATEAVDLFLPAGEQGGEPWLRFMTTEEAKTQGETQGTRGPAGWETKELTD